MRIVIFCPAMRRHLYDVVNDDALAQSLARNGRAFLLGGNAWRDRPLPPNVRYAGHVYTRDHSSTARRSPC